MKTVKEILEATSGYLGKKGIDSPLLNAQLLLAQVLGMKNKMDLYLQFDRPLGESELAPLREMMKRRGAGEPLQHILGTVEFHGRVFKTDRRALIPRPETELLAELILTDPARPERILDVGVGSGVLVLTLAAECPEATVHGVDISPEALALAGENARALGLEGRVQLWQSDLLAGVTEQYDLLVANLPYISTGELPALAREVQHDPRLALEGGARGVELIERLLVQAPSRLRAGGGVALEIGAGQAEPLMEHLQRLGYKDARSKADYTGTNRFLFAKYG